MEYNFLIIRGLTVSGNKIVPELTVIASAYPECDEETSNAKIIRERYVLHDHDTKAPRPISTGQLLEEALSKDRVNKSK